jgi:hypothetical protein
MAALPAKRDNPEDVVLRIVAEMHIPSESVMIPNGKFSSFVIFAERSCL